MGIVSSEVLLESTECAAYSNGQSVGAGVMTAVNNKSKSKNPNNHKEMLAALVRKDASGIRNCVPVFGTGLNLQAATMEGYKNRDDWWRLLIKIGERIDISEQQLQTYSNSNLALWETMLCNWAEE